MDLPFVMFGVYKRSAGPLGGGLSHEGLGVKDSDPDQTNVRKRFDL